MRNKNLLNDGYLKIRKEVKGMVASDGNGKVVINKQVLLPLGLVAAVIMAIIAGVSFVKGLESNIESTDFKIDTHLGDPGSHLPYKEQLDLWYSRNEGEKLENAIISIDDKLDRLIERELGE